MGHQGFVGKAGAILRKGPATARNIVFSWFDYWPTRPLRNAAMLKLPVYCITQRQERRRRRIVEGQLDTLGFGSVEFVEAVPETGLSLAEIEAMGSYDEAAARSHHGRPLSPGEVSCSLKHGRCYELIASRGQDAALIIEDDVLFVPSRLEKVDLAGLPTGWDVVYLNSFTNNGRPRQALAGALYDDRAHTGSAAAYLITGACAAHLATRYKPVIHAGDGFLSRAGLRQYMYYPDCVLNGSVCHYYRSTSQYVPPV